MNVNTGCTAMDKKAERLKWFRDAKFGMFIHWGLYSHLAGEWKGRLITQIGEQIMRFCSIPAREYEQVAKDFNPVKFNAEAWVLLARDAGMKYIVITAKHHDGFAMYHSKCSEYNIVDATPYGRDPMKDLAEACRKHDIKLCFYYSHYQDWHHPDGGVNPPVWDGKPLESRNFENYMREKAIPQVTELLTQYGPIGIIWFDTPSRMEKKYSEEFANLVHTLQPDCLVGPRVGHGFGDYQGFGDNMVPHRSDLGPWEACATMNETWGYRKNAHNWKSTESMIRLLVSIVGKGGNYLLNVGPTGEGVIPEESVERLREMGEWMRINGEAIYGTTGGLVPYEMDWGTITARPGKLYFHFFEWPGRSFTFKGLRNKVKKAYMLADKEQKALPVTQGYDAAGCHELTVLLPGEAPNKYVTVMVLEIYEPADLDTSIKQDINGNVSLDAFLSEIHKDPEEGMLTVNSTGYTENWFNSKDWLSWEFIISEPGTFEAVMNTYAEREGSGPKAGQWEGGHEFVISVGNLKKSFIVEDHGRNLTRDNYRQQNIRTHIGKISFDKPGKYTLCLCPVNLVTEKNLGPKLRSLELRRV